jgi:3-hydroxypropionyl-CoA synthetase (ADP-forming)
VVIIYQDYGFNAPRSEVAAGADEAATLAARIGFPVALKIVSPDILHKTDVGGVELGLASEAAVRAAFSRIMRSVQEKASQAHIEGVRVEEMCTVGIEIIIGLIVDAQFGPTIMFGLGGIFTEILHNVSFRVLPITEQDARSMIEDIQGRTILAGYRGQPPVSREMLVDLLLKAGRMGLDLADRLDSVDLNPIMVWEDQHRVLDAKILLRPQSVPWQDGRPDTSHLDVFFKASSVALIGASATPGKIGNAILDSLAKYQYQGKVYPVNPSREEIMGLKAWPSLSAIPDPIDLVVVTVALPMVPALIRECSARGVHNMVIISGGGKELGGESEELEAAIKALARENDLRVVGPNCIGVFDGETRLDTFFQVHERMVRPRKGPIAILTQSGTVGAALLEAAWDIGVSKFVSYGNRLDVDEADLIAYLADDPSTKVIACYIEGLEDGRKFLSAAREVSAKKPIVVFKAGRSRQGARASMSHTGFFGGTYGVTEGAFQQAGLIVTDSCEELCAIAKALALQPPAPGARVAMISNGAGAMVQAIDLLEKYGLEMAPLAAETIARLKKVYPSYYLAQNPVDVTGSATSADYEIGIVALLEDPNVDIVMPWFVFQDTPLGEDIAEVLGRLSRMGFKPILCAAMGGTYTEKMSRALEAEGVPVYHSVRDWMAAAGGAAQWGARVFNRD